LGTLSLCLCLPIDRTAEYLSADQGQKLIECPDTGRD
jgi:hypothetical protein